jgi:hypothetical protein
MKLYVLFVLLLVSCGQGELWLPTDPMSEEDCIEYVGYAECYVWELQSVSPDTFLVSNSATSETPSSEVLSSERELGMGISSAYSSYDPLSSSYSSSQPLSSFILPSVSSTVISSSSAPISSVVTPSSSAISSSVYVVSSAVSGCSEPAWQQMAYNGGDVVTGSDGNCYVCKSAPYSGWCGASAAYKPTSGWAWGDAWTKQ